jgi:glycogen operon protein
MNMHWDRHAFQLPRLPKGRKWRRFVDTALPAPHEIREPGKERLLPDQDQYAIGARSVIILVGR